MARTPRYLELANALRRDIAQGRVAVGGQLPTEYALCSAHGVSRHTARAALQVLADEGLIDRRPGLGTKVVSRGEAAGFRQALGGLGALLNYAHETQLEILSTARRALTDAESDKLRGEKSPPWLVLSGVRRAGERLIAATTIYVADWVGAKVDDLGDPALAVTEQIEQRFGVSVGRIHQSLTAGLMGAGDAAALGATPGGPMLVAIRRYSDAKGRLFVISESRHPADRFSYEMDFERRRKDAPR